MQAFSLGKPASRLQDHIDNLARLRPGATETHYAAGLLASKEGRDDDAIEHFSRALANPSELVPTEVIWADLSLSFAKVGHIPEAIEACQHAIESMGSGDGVNAAVYHSNLADFVVSQGDLARGERLYGKALRYQPDYTQALLGMASVSLRRGELTLAKQHALAASLQHTKVRALVGEPHFYVPAYEGQLRLAIVMEVVGQSKLASEAWEAVLASNPNAADRELAEAGLARLSLDKGTELARGTLPAMTLTAAAADPLHRDAQTP